ncbi:dehalogenase [Dehalogenimonas etheniformans]|uniref:Dehalogenase n=1 Tax=Dehalogenimonas etheniformans TaxID=1536648 RepID=A0A2P5PA47_9CHLR|nr:dehalogenase [Dehalogenimonas etheniformans]PPD59179.1 dehalogenase [Dehalogenimonas etheniformans]QNT75779.1 dehalogenase [Dehalogenimonas etheniformans]
MWFFVALVVGAGLVGIAWWLSKRNISLKWYDWLIGIAGLLLLMFTIQNVLEAVEERVTKAPMMLLLVTGLPALILLAIAWQLAVRRARGAKA